MNVAHNRKANWLFISSIVLFLAWACLIAIDHRPTWVDGLMVLAMCLWVILFYASLCYYAASKGYSPLLGLLMGLLSIIGFLILLALPDKAKK
jgi:hypothetical protein